MSLVAYWPLGDDYAYDRAFGRYNGSTKGNPSVVDGKVGTAYDFDGSGDYVSVPAFDDYGWWTVALWFNSDDVTNIAHLTGVSTDDEDGWTPLSHWAINNGDMAWWDGVDGWRYAGASLSTGTWYHATLQYDGTSVKMYLDGSLVNDEPNNLSNPEGHLDVIGRREHNNDRHFDGRIQDVRFYDHALSKHEVKELARAKVGHWTFDGMGEVETFEDQRTKPGWSMPNAYIQDWSVHGDYSIGSWDQGSIDMTWRPPQLEGGRRIQSFSYWWQEGSSQSGHQVRLYDSNGNTVQRSETENPQWQLSDGSNNMSTLASPGYNEWTLYSFSFDWAAGTYDYYLTNNSGTTETGTKNLVRTTDVERIDFVGTNGTKCSFDDISYALPEATDQSPQGNHGTLKGDLQVRGANIGSHALEFDGVDDKVSLDDGPDVFSSPSPKTIAAWIYTRDTTKSQRAVSFRSSADILPFWIAENSNGQMSIWQNGNYHSNLTSVPENAWVHLAVTDDGSTVRLYKNGSQVASVSSSPDTSGGGGDGLGYDPSGVGNGWADYLDGMLDDVRTYAEALSDQAIQDLYQTRARMDEQSRFFTQGFEEPRERMVIEDGTWSVGSSEYKVFTNVAPNDTDLSDWVEPDDTLGSIFIEGWVHVSDTTYVPTTLEYTKDNNDKGFYCEANQSAADRVPSSWRAGWNYIKVPVDRWSNQSNTPWGNMDRLQIYRSGPDSGDSNQTIRFKDLKLRKYPGHTTEPGLSKTGLFRTSQVSEVGPAPESLVGWWDFGRKQANDKAGLHDGTLNGNASIVGDQFGGMALQCDGDGDYVDIGDASPELAFGTGDFTCSALVTFNTTGSTRTIIEISKYTHGLLIRPEGSDLSIYLDDYNTGGRWTNINFGFSNGETCLVTLTRTNGVLEAYKNDVSQGTNNLGGDITINQQTYIGASVHNTGQSFDGKIHDLRLYDRALSAEEVSILHEMSGSDPKLKMTSSGIYTPAVSETRL